MFIFNKCTHVPHDGKLSHFIIHKFSYYFACQTVFVIRLMERREANIFCQKLFGEIFNEMTHLLSERNQIDERKILLEISVFPTVRKKTKL